MRRAGVKTRGRVVMQLRCRSWNESAIDQAETILACDVSDEELEKRSRDQTGGSLHAFLLHRLRPLSGPLAAAH
jgi:hypothetical protein